MRKEIDEYGTTRYFNENWDLHREDGPAIESVNGDKFWLINGERHREDGPAIETANGDKAWFLNGKRISEEEFNDAKRNR